MTLEQEMEHTLPRFFDNLEKEELGDKSNIISIGLEFLSRSEELILQYTTEEVYA